MMIHKIKCEKCKELFLFHSIENFKLPKICFKCIQKIEKEFFNPELGEPYINKLQAK